MNVDRWLKTSRLTYPLLLLILLLVTVTVMVTVKMNVNVKVPLPSEESMFYFPRVDEKENRTIWAALQSMSNPIKEEDVNLSHMYQQYKTASTSTRPLIAKEILDAVTKLAYLNSRVDMIGLLLLGPRKVWPTLRSVYPPTLDRYPPGLESTLKLFEKQCGVITEHSIKRSLAKIYNHVFDKEAMHEAIILACGMLHKVESHGIDMTNPKTRIAPAPVHGSLQYCGRVSVNGIPRPKVVSYGKIHQVTVVPSKMIPPKHHGMIHICFHRNDSLGLCRCEKDEWMSIQYGSWSSLMPPYEKRFVDVKFATQMYDFVTVTLDEGLLPAFVTVTLDEVSPAQGCRDGLLAGLIALLFITVCKYIFSQDGVVQNIKWVMCVLAATCLFMGYIGTSLFKVAVGSCLALYYTITSIIAPILSKMTMLWPWIRFGQGLPRSADFSKKECEELTRKLVVELVSSKEFEDWMIKNAERIKVCPCG